MTYSCVPGHVAPDHQVLADGEPRVDVGLAVLVVSVVEVKGEKDATPTDCDNVFLEISVSCVIDVRDVIMNTENAKA